MKDKVQCGRTYRLALTAILAALASVLQYLEFPLPFLAPSFIKMDFSDLPALIGTFAITPLTGVIITLIRNVIHILVSQSLGVGELCNFLLSAFFVLVAGSFYAFHKDRRSVMFGTAVGALAMAALSLPINYYVTYPFYAQLMKTDMETLLKYHQAIFPFVQNLWQALLISNVPFTLLKGLLNVVLIGLLYKKIIPLLRNKREKKEKNGSE